MVLDRTTQGERAVAAQSEREQRSRAGAANSAQEVAAERAKRGSVTKDGPGHYDTAPKMGDFPGDLGGYSKAMKAWREKKKPSSLGQAVNNMRAKE